MSYPVDHSEIKFGQLATITLASVALYLQDARYLWFLGAILFLGGTPLRPFSPFVFIYKFFIKPLTIMKPDYRLDNIQSHKFGQLVGVLTVGMILSLFYFNFTLSGWVAVGILIGLTTVSYLGWCIGCFIYYQLNRLGIKGFFKHAPADKTVIPGQRPGKE